MADSPAIQRLRRHNDDDEDDVGAMTGSDAPASEAPAPGLSRANEICQGRKLIQETQQRLKQLERDHGRHVERASLLVNAERGWGYMGYRERRNPANILLALQSPKRPACLSWENFENHFSWSIQQDKEILMARLQYVPGFEERYTTRTFDVPRSLRGDREVMMELCQRDPTTLKHASKALKDDRELVMVAVSKNPSVLAHASPKLKGDRRIARTVLGRPNGIKAFTMLSRKLQEDPKLALFAIRATAKTEDYQGCHLEDLPEHFRDDEDVVLEAVKQCGGNLRSIKDKTLLKDYDVIYQACSNDGNALEFVPECSARQAMLKGNNLMTVLSRGGGRFLSEAPATYQKNPEFVLTAVENGYADASLVKYYESDKDFFLDLIASSNKIDELYDNLTEDVRNQKDVVLALLKNELVSTYRIRSIVDRHDDLFLEEDALLEVVRRGCLSALGRKTVSELMKDKAFVLKACAVDGNCLQYASDDLKKDMECIMTAFLNSEEPMTLDAMLHELPEEVWDNDDIVERIIQLSDTDDCTTNLLREHIPNMNSRRVYLACLDQGWPARAMPYSARSAYEDDEEVVLATLKHQKKMGGSAFYHHIADSLRSDRDFLKRAIAVDPCVLSFASESLRYDYDLMLLAVGSCRSALLTASHMSSMSKLVDFATLVRERKAVVDNFVLEFLRGVALEGPNTAVSPPPKKRQRTARGGSKRQQKKEEDEKTSGCHLPLLNCGAETGVALKRHIGEFVGVPFGSEYKLLQTCSDNLEFWGY